MSHTSEWASSPKKTRHAMPSSGMVNNHPAPCAARLRGHNALAVHRPCFMCGAHTKLLMGAVWLLSSCKATAGTCAAAKHKCASEGNECHRPARRTTGGAGAAPHPNVQDDEPVAVQRKRGQQIGVKFVPGHPHQRAVVRRFVQDRRVLQVAATARSLGQRRRRNNYSQVFASVQCPQPMRLPQVKAAQGAVGADRCKDVHALGKGHVKHLAVVRNELRLGHLRLPRGYTSKLRVSQLLMLARPMIRPGRAHGAPRRSRWCT